MSLVSFSKGAAGAVLFILATLTAFGEGNFDVKECRGVNLEIAEEHMMQIKECLTEFKAKEISEVAPADLPCFGKCVFVKNGVFDEKGMPHKEKLQSIITDHLPKVVHDDLNKKLETCLLPETTEIIDTKDETCTTYVPFMMCIHLSFMEECEGEGNTRRRRRRHSLF